MADIQPAVTLQEWVATTLEFTLQKTDVVWAKPLLQRVVSEVPHATRNKVSEFIKAQGAYLKPKHSSASGKCETALWGVRRHRREWLLRGLFVDMTSWPQCAMP